MRLWYHILLEACCYGRYIQQVICCWLLRQSRDGGSALWWGGRAADEGGKDGCRGWMHRWKGKTHPIDAAAAASSGGGDDDVPAPVTITRHISSPQLIRCIRLNLMQQATSLAITSYILCCSSQYFCRRQCEHRTTWHWHGPMVLQHNTVRLRTSVMTLKT